MHVNSLAYNQWVAGERVRLEYAHAIDFWAGYDKLYGTDLAKPFREGMESLTADQKKRRLLFAKGRKEGRRR